MTTSHRIAIALAAAAALAVPQRTDAQLGGLIKKKVSEAVKPAKEAAKPAAESQQRSIHNSDVLVLSAATVSTMTSAMAAEQAMIDDFRKVLAKYPTPEEYKACQNKVMTSPEGLRIASKMGELPETYTPEQLQSLVNKVGAEMEALTKKSCPLDPADWQDYKRRDKLIEIHRKATFAFDTIRIRGVQGEGDGAAAPSDGMGSETAVRRNDVIIERLIAYCTAKAEGVDVSGDSNGLRFPGAGEGIYWVYTKEELDFLNTFDCDKFLARHKKLAL